jgi:putative acetyltransferase
MSVSIEDESQRHETQVYDLVSSAFGQQDESNLINALRDGGHVVASMIAIEDGAIVGHILLSKLEDPKGFLALAPVAVSPARQQQGIGSALIKRAIAKVRTDGWLGIFLLGDPAFYTRFGFRVEDAAKFETPYPKNYFMALELSPGALAKTSGSVVYPTPFSELG